MCKSQYDYFRIKRTKISVIDEDKAINAIIDFVKQKQKGYVCVSTLRTVVVANKDDAYFKVMEESLINIPDGTPLVWCAHLWGLKQVERACGPHIFPKMLKIQYPHLRHFFLGDTEEHLAALTYKATTEFGANIVGSYSPPFIPIEEYNIESIAQMINDSGANLVWTALRAPKQDYLNAKLLPYLNDGIVCIGVGAAFRSVLGILQQPDGFLQKIGLAGLAFKRPETTRWDQIKWYMKHSAYLFRYFISIVSNRIFGKNYRDM